MQQYDLTTAQGQQQFQQWVTQVIRNEINSYVKQVLFDRNTAYVDNSDNGNPSGLTDSDRITRLEQAVFRR